MDDNEYLKSIHLSFENNKETEKYLVLSAKNYNFKDDIKFLTTVLVFNEYINANLNIFTNDILHIATNKAYKWFLLTYPNTDDAYVEGDGIPPDDYEIKTEIKSLLDNIEVNGAKYIINNIELHASRVLHFACS